ncbi:MAG: PAS domain S-box protein [Gallionellaceae bacterium]|nr:PAS domain S-box protein [Gallionellaceae bacterium]
MSQKQQRQTALILSRPWDRMRLDRVLPWLVLAVSLAITHQLWQGAQTHAEHELQSRFDYLEREANELIKQRMKVYEQVLHGARGLFYASTGVGRREFSAFVKEQHLDENYPGIQGLCFSAIVPPEQKNQHIAAIRKQGFPAYAIWPEGERDIYTPAIYLEPFSGRNQRAFGFDNYADPVRRAAMEQARDSGNAALSGKVTLLHEDKNTQQAGFRMYLPVYKNGAPHDTLAGRRASIIGWVYAPFAMNDLMAGILGAYAANADIQIFDGEELSDRNLMYDGSRRTGSKPSGSRFLAIRRIRIAGHTWTVAAYSLPGFEAQLDKDKPQFIANAGIGASLLLALLAWLLATSRKRALDAAEKMNRELIGSEARFRAFSDNLPAAVYLKDRDGRHIMVNRYFEQIIDKPQAGILGKAVFDLFPAETARAFAANDRKTLESKQASTHEESVYVDGRERIYQSIKFPIIGDNGEVLGTGGISIDITDRKQAEDLLHTLHTAIKQSPTSIVIADQDGIIQYVNPYFTEVTGYTSAEVIGQNPRILQSGQTTKETYLELWGKITSDQVWHGELLNKRKNGELYWEDAHIAPVKNPAGIVTHYVAIKVDITKRKQAEKEIEFKNTLLSTLNEHSPDGMLVVDENEKILFANKQFTDMWGIASDVMDTRLDDLVLKSVLDKLADPRQLLKKMEYLGTHRQETTMDELPLRDGRTIDCYSTPIIGSDAKYYGRVRYLRDITGRKQAEEALRASEERWRFALEGAGDGIWEWNLQTGEMIISKAGKAMFGFAEDETGNDISEWQARIHPEDRARLMEDTLAYLHSKDAKFSTEYRLRCKDGSWRWTYVRGMATSRAANGHVLRMIGTHSDITWRKQAEKKLRTSEANLNAILDNSPYLIWLKDTDGRFIKVNQPFFKTTGLKQMQDVLGKTDFDLWPKEMAEKYRADDAEVMSARQQKLVEEMSIMENGKMQWVETFKVPILDDKGQVLGTTGFAQNITMRKNAEDRIRRLANYDSLTDLPNRTLLGDRLQQALVTARRDKARMALMFLDLDQFKPINDTLGHAVGDLLLKEAAKRMQDCVRESDTVARMGGDEFIVLLPSIETEQDAMVVAEKIRLALCQPFELAGENLRISSSIGIAVYPEHGSEEEMLLRNADDAMYCAKKSGRNTVQIFRAPENSE